MCQGSYVPMSANARGGQKRASIPSISIGELPVRQCLPSFQEEHMGRRSLEGHKALPTNLDFLVSGGIWNQDSGEEEKLVEH